MIVKYIFIELFIFQWIWPNPKVKFWTTPNFYPELSIKFLMLVGLIAFPTFYLISLLFHGAFVACSILFAKVYGV